MGKAGPGRRAGLRRLVFAFLVGGTLALFWPLRGHLFISLDDGAYIVKNPAVSTGLTWENVRWAFTAEHSGNWHPLTWLSHMLDVQLFGLDAGRHHLVSAAFHAANAGLLLVAMLALTGALWPSAIVAALFAWHPLHVESVAWAAERKDVLSTCFWMLTLLAYVRYARRPDLRRYLLVVLALSLGLMAKPMLVTMPFVLLLLDFWPLGRLRTHPPAPAAGAHDHGRWGGLLPPLLDKLPLLALSAASSLVTVDAQRKSEALLELMYSPVGDRIANALLSYATYLALTLWPAGLAIFYPHPQGAWDPWRVALSAAFLGGLTLPALALRRRAPALLTGWFWYIGTLVPVIGLVQVGDQGRADRYTYVPLVGIFIALAAGAATLAARRRLAVAGAVVVAVACLATATWRQIGTWQSGLTVYGHATAAVPGSWLGFANLAMELEQAGRRQEGSEALKKAYALNPQLRADTYCSAAGLYEQRGDLRQALEELRSALRVAPGHRGATRKFRELLQRHPETYALLAPASGTGERDRPALRYCRAGNELGRLGLFAEAIAAFRAAIQLEPGLAAAYNGLGSSLGNLGKFQEAEKAFVEALRLQPGLAEAQGNLAAVRGALRR